MKRVPRKPRKITGLEYYLFHRKITPRTRVKYDSTSSEEEVQEKVGSTNPGETTSSSKSSSGPLNRETTTDIGATSAIAITTDSSTSRQSKKETSSPTPTPTHLIRKKLNL